MLNRSHWLHEAHVAIDSANAMFTSASSMTAPACQNLFTGIELCIKAVIVARRGSVPKAVQTHDLVAISQRIGLWHELPSDLQGLLSEMNPFNPHTRYPNEPAYSVLVNSSTPGEWQGRIGTATALVEFVEHQVIHNPSVLNRLQV